MKVDLLREIRSQRGVEIIYISHPEGYMIEIEEVCKGTCSHGKEIMIWQDQKFKTFKRALVHAHKRMKGILDPIKRQNATKYHMYP